MGGKRKLHLDFLRILAAFLVLVHHSELMELLDHTQSGMRGIFVLSCMTSFVFVNVPLFFMISGALLLGREESDRVIYGRRFPRFLLLTFLVNLFTYVYRCYPSFIAGDFFRGFFAGIMDETHWYLYAYLAFLISLPLWFSKGVRRLGPLFPLFGFLFPFFVLAAFPYVRSQEFLVWQSFIALTCALLPAYLLRIGVFSEEKEGSYRPFRVLKSSSAPSYGIADSRYGSILPNYPPVQFILKVK